MKQQYIDLINDHFVDDYQAEIGDLCVDEDLKKLKASLHSFDVALIRLPISLTIPQYWTPDHFKVNTLCWKTANLFNYNHLTLTYLAGYGVKAVDTRDTSLKQPSLNWIRKIVIEKDYYPDANNLNFVYASDDNMKEVDEASVLLRSIDDDVRSEQGVSYPTPPPLINQYNRYTV